MTTYNVKIEGEQDTQTVEADDYEIVQDTRGERRVEFTRNEEKGPVFMADWYNVLYIEREIQ